MMNLDLSSARRLLNACPRWVRITAVGSVFLGMILQTLCTKLARPVMEPYFQGTLDINSLNQLDWILIGGTIAFPVIWLWRRFSRSKHEQTVAEKTEEYIAAIKRSMDEAEISKADRKLFWRSIFSKIARDFKVGSSLPPAEQVAVETRTDIIT